MKPIHTALALLSTLALTSCTTTEGSNATRRNEASRQAMLTAIAAEPKGTYYIARRYFKSDYKFWGFIRKSGSPWSTAQLVLLNENTQLAPDRQAGQLGSDNNYEYKFTGHFTGQTIYEPASNGFYPEFLLKSHELLSKDPAPIYREPGATDPTRRIIAKPY